MQRAFHLHVLKAFARLIADHHLRAVVDPDEVVYLVSDSGYALQIADERDDTTVWYLMIGPDGAALGYNLVFETGRHRPELSPLAEWVANPVTLDDRLGNLALLVARRAPDALAGDTTWLRAVGQPVRESPRTAARLHDLLRGALPT